MALSFMALLLVAIGAWSGAVFVTAVLAFYLLAMRLTRCRVQTRQGTPCQWLVRGLVGTCDWHRGLKRGLPHLLRVPRAVLPRFMWLRPDMAVAAMRTTDPQPAAGAGTIDATAPDAVSPGYDWAILGLEVVSALVAVLEPRSPGDIGLIAPTAGLSTLAVARHLAGRRAACAATVRGGWDRGGGDQGYYGVVLDLAGVDECVRAIQAAIANGDQPKQGLFARLLGGH